jgi:DNA-binding transcriptional LysR family regulator
LVRSPKADAAGLRVEPLLAEPMVAALPAGHGLSRTGGRIALAALAGETFVLYRRPAGPGLYDAILAACHAAGFNPEIGQEAPRLPSSLSLVAAGLGVSIVPASMRRLDSDGVAYAELDGCPDLVAPLLLATRRTDRSAVLRRFREQVRQAASDSTAPSGSSDPR